MPPFLTIRRQRCIKFGVLREQDFYTPLALNCQKGQHLSALEVYKISVSTSLILSRNADLVVKVVQSTANLGGEVDAGGGFAAGLRTPWPA